MSELRGSVAAFRALNHNALHSLGYQIKRGRASSVLVRTNMEVFDRRCKKIVEMERTQNLQNLQNQQTKELWVID